MSDKKDEKSILSDETEHPMRRGEQYLQDFEYDLAMEEFQKYITEKPNDATGYLGMSRVYYAMANQEESFNWAHKAIESDPFDVRGFCHFANLLVDYGQPEEAKKYLEKARRINPDHFNYLFAYGHYCNARDEVEEAEKYFRQCLEKVPETRKNQVLIHLGMVLSKFVALRNQIHRTDEAIECFIQGIDLNPLFLAGYFTALECLVAINKPDIVLMIAEKGLDHFPQIIRFRIMLIWALIGLNRTQEAVQLTELLIPEIRNDADSLLRLGEVALYHHFHEQAIYILDLGLKIEPNHYEGLLLMANAYEQHGNSAKAREYQAKAEEVKKAAEMK